MKITQEMKDMAKVQLAFLATADNEGNPNIGPKRTTRVLDDHRLIICENTDGQHHKNIKANGKIAIVYIDRENSKGFRFVGKATSYTDQEKLDLAEKVVGVRPKAACIIVDVEKIYTMDSGAKAGKLVTE